ncbi:anthranilate synthase family protein [Streptomyces aidingensis]|uniref:anthranilate synthase n=1 Tax=Streptomyces aidingensis TaxID=910347 RepID=A0A1I1FH78_9ACTN|nr:anthranilate synthase family protein [Streptomyces aidingensis]SFB98306.1 phenazine biosynthesis protein phzE [Streptomyces aidingensis]
MTAGRTAGPAGEDAAALLEDVLALRAGAFALLHRPERAPGRIEILAGRPTTVDTLAELPLPAADGAGPAHDLLALVPYRQLAERGFTCTDDGTPLLALSVTRQAVLPLAEVTARIPERPVKLTGEGFDTDDAAYADTVRRIVTDEIGRGEGANFVIKRSYTADIEGYTPHAALAFFRRLLERESGAYWTFLVHTGDRTLVGATPERHVTLDDATATMNPISGTYRYPASGPSLSGLMDFLADPKEADELYMVVDEELKMMARFCDSGVRVTGPYLKEMARLAHTEYLLEGRTGRDPREILRSTMFAPTVTGSPLESACRVIDRYETGGRGYYSGVLALIGRDARGGRALDSAILIRTADIDAAGRARIAVGSTLVRDSDPQSEAAETAAKAAGLLAALDPERPRAFARHDRVLAALERRNETLAGFWLGTGTGTGAGTDPETGGLPLAGRRVLIVDAEDTFTSMMAYQLRALGPEVTIRRFDEPYTADGHDLVVMGPGPGDPTDLSHPKIRHLDETIAALLAGRRPFLAVCLSHQVLSARLGLGLFRRERPNQGTQLTIDLFGTREQVGFYNTFAARAEADVLDAGGLGKVQVSRDPDTREVHALRGPFFASMQFHAESVLTRNGPRITADLLRGLS